MSNDERTLLGARIPAELKQLVDADPRSNQRVVEEALWDEFGGERVSAVERELEEKRERLSLVQEEIGTREDERQTLEEEIRALEARRETIKEDDGLTPEHRRKLSMIPAEVSHPVVQSIAEETGLSPEEIVEEADA